MKRERRKQDEGRDTGKMERGEEEGREAGKVRRKRRRRNKVVGGRETWLGVEERKE